jgi:hypothetical protein
MNENKPEISGYPFGLNVCFDHFSPCIWLWLSVFIVRPYQIYFSYIVVGSFVLVELMVYAEKIMLM